MNGKHERRKSPRVTDRTMRRWRERLEEHGYNGLTDRRKGKPSRQRVAPHQRGLAESSIGTPLRPGIAARTLFRQLVQSAPFANLQRLA
jgi:hypothetical protein